MPAKGADVTVTQSPLTQTDQPQAVAETITGTGLKRAIYDLISVTDGWAPAAFPVVGDQKTPNPDIFGRAEGLRTADEVAALIPLIADARENQLRSLADLSNTLGERIAELGALTVAANRIVQPLDDLIIVDGVTAGANVTVSLPLAADTRGRIIYVRNGADMGGFSTVFAVSGSDTVNGTTPPTVAGNNAVRVLMSDGVSDWSVVSAA